MKDKKVNHLKTPLGICTLYTIIYLIIYRAIIGFSLYEHWGTSDISAIIGCILGGPGSDYPTDFLQKTFLVLLIIEVFLLIYTEIKSKNKNKFNNNQDDIDKLNQLKDLLDKNVITQEDFEMKKNDILNKL